jgi:DNA-binding MarR family transcriptional regulator
MRHKKTHLRPLLLMRSDWMEERVLQKAEQSGYGQITPAMNRLFAHMTGQPIGLSELARRLGVSRQAVHKLANEAAKHGLVEFVACDTDARVVNLQFSAAGWTMSERASRDFDAIDAQLVKRLGAKNVAELKRLLSLAWSEDEETD